MESIRRLLKHWRSFRHCQFSHSFVVYLYFFSNHGLSAHRIHDFSFLEKSKKLYDTAAADYKRAQDAKNAAPMPDFVRQFAQKVKGKV